MNWWDAFKWGRGWQQAGDSGKDYLAANPSAWWTGLIDPARSTTPNSFYTYLQKQFDPMYARFQYQLGSGQDANLNFGDWALGQDATSDWRKMAPYQRGETPSRFTGRLNWRI